VPIIRTHSPRGLKISSVDFFRYRLTLTIDTPAEPMTERICTTPPASWAGGIWLPISPPPIAVAAWKTGAERKAALRPSMKERKVSRGMGEGSFWREEE
jgi:hypothetical protein